MGMYADLKAIPKEKLEAYFDNDFEDEYDEFDQYPSCELDKMWDILNFVLINPKNDMANIKLLENVIFGKECYNPEVAEDGDLPTCYNDEILTKKLSNELQKINFENLVSKFE